MIAIIDYGVGNLRSVEKAFIAIGADAVLTNDINTIKNAQAIVLPGVGAFEDGMESLKKLGLIEVILEAISRKTPFLGICLGMQLLLEVGDESNEAIVNKTKSNLIDGMAVIKGSVKRFPNIAGLKIPQMGWNTVSYRIGSRLFEGIEQNQFFYFVHSYYCELESEAEVAGLTEYGVLYHSALEVDNIFATQFHPEKSGELGLKVLKNFVAIATAHSKEEKKC